MANLLPLSPSTARVVVVLLEKKVPFEFVEVSLAKGKDDEGFIVYESRAIARYIDAKYDHGSSLVPKDLKGLAMFEQAVSLETNTFEPPAFIAFHQVLINPLLGITPDQKLVQLAIISAKLDVYDQILAKQKFIAGDVLTLADLFHLPYGHALKKIGSDIMYEKPNVARWWKEISERPAWITVKDGVKIAGYP
ncbi:glutathione S-transferase [Mycena floridula]|nr:glutathione S-transferase [Mycena floridula]